MAAKVLFFCNDFAEARAHGEELEDALWLPYCGNGSRRMWLRSKQHRNEWQRSKRQRSGDEWQSAGTGGASGHGGGTTSSRSRQGQPDQGAARIRPPGRGWHALPPTTCSWLGTKRCARSFAEQLLRRGDQLWANRASQELRVVSRRHREQCEGEPTPSLGLACLGVQYLGVPTLWGLIN
jgi:hypothetical protein